MKPIKLSMTAFGPFAGTEIIDFKEIAKEPVFLICGPTGAGKTTIFDAISYALFGDASGEERKPDGMRSDFAQDDLLTEVELIFEVKGKEYRIMRQPRQYRRKKSGDGVTEVAAKAELIYADDKGEPLVFTKTAEIVEKIKEIIGLGSEQFKQIMMLPQGEFRKLLTADSKEREAILREIFDAECYLRFQLRLKEESDRLEKEIKEIRNIQNQWILQLQPDQTEDDGGLTELLQREEIDRRELFAAIEAQNDRDGRIADEKKRSAEQISTRINEEKQILFRKQQENEKLGELRAVQLKMTELKAEADNIIKKEEEVRRIQNAVALKPYAENCRKLQSQIERLKEEIKEMAEQSERMAREKEAAEQEYRISKSPEYRLYGEQIEQEIQHLKQQIPMLETLLKLKTEYGRLAKEGKTAEQQLQQAVENKKRLQDKRKTENQILADTDSTEEQKGILEKKITRYRKVKEIFEKYREQKRDAGQLQVQEQMIQEKLRQAEEEYQKAVESERHDHVLALRSELQEGDICPVCNGVYHEMPEGKMTGGHTENRKEAENNRDNYRRKWEAFRQKQTEINTKKNALLELLLQESETEDEASAEHYLTAEEKESDQNTMRMQECLEQLTRRKAAMETLKQLETELEEASNREEKAKAEYDEKRSQLDRVIGEGKTLKEAIDEEYRDVAGPEGIGVLREQLRHRQDEKNQRLAKEEALEENYRRITALQVETKTGYDNLRKQEAERSEQYREENADFLKKQRQAGFSEERLWAEAAGKEEDQAVLTEEIQKYQEEYLKTTDLEKRLLTEVKIESEHDLGEAAAQIEELERRRESNSTEAVELLARRKENIRILHGLTEMEGKRQKQMERFREISTFAKVANGENGKRLTFERYVLAAFLEDVLQMANYRLEKMTGRYQLKRKEEVTHRGRQSGLEIEVFDAFTGKTRSIHTLSGGEGFKSALAMALGLSEVVSSYAGGIELDMLLIDEGFGTLDPESLDTAIDCILDLQSKGKIIGIISHVAELKERIPAKLEVRQTPEGSYTEYRSGVIR